MQGGRDPFFGFGDPFGSFSGMGGFGGQRSLMPSFFGGRDPFDNPFFAPPFGNMFESSLFGSNGGQFMNMSNGGPFMNMSNGGPFMNSNPSGFLQHQPSISNRSKGPIIEELKSDDDKDEDEDEKEKKLHSRKHGRSSKEPIVEDPDEEAAEKKIKHVPQRNYLNLAHPGKPQPQPQTQCFTFQSSSVSYGGANGAHYSTSSTRRTGTDGLTFEEFKEANSATLQATHRVSKGMHERGHSFTRKLNSDGHVDTTQTLHNLNEDELVGFERAWTGNAQKHLPGWNEQHASRNFIASGGNQQPHMRGGWALPSSERSGGNQQPHMTRGGGWALPSSERSNGIGGSKPDSRRGAGITSRQPGRMKADVRNGAGSSSFGTNGVGRTH